MPEGKPKKKRYSPSRLNTYKQCPTRYKFKYIEKKFDGHQTIELLVGNLVHDALEWLHENVLTGNIPKAEEVVAYYGERWEQRYHEGIKIVKDRTAESYYVMGEKCITDYYERYHPFDKGKIVGLEIKVEAPIGENRYLWGYIDRLAVIGPGHYEIRDYKTGRWVPSRAESQEDWQLAIYQICVQYQFEDCTECTLVWNYLQRNLERRITKSSDDIRDLTKQINNLINNIEIAEREYAKGRDGFAPKVSRLCDWCGFKERCPAFTEDNDGT